MSLRVRFPKKIVLKCASLCLTLKILNGMMKSNFVQKVLFPILRYGIAIVLGYFTGNGDIPSVF